jgi:PAS domain S-box-containing protein
MQLAERLHAQEALRTSEFKFRTLYEHVTEGVALHHVVRDADGKVMNYRVIDVNPAYEKHTGLNRHQVLGTLANELYKTPNPPFLTEFTQVVDTGVPHSFESYFAPLGKHFFISVVKFMPEHFATVFEDITERKVKEAELQQKNEEMSRFAYTVSHDLKSPLVTIKTFLGYLEKDCKKQDAVNMEKDMAFIRNAADKMGLLLEELLELSRVGRHTRPSEELPLQEITREALDLVAGQLAQRKVQVKVTPAPLWITGDRVRLVELFQNLVDNAVKFMGDQPDPQIEIGVDEQLEPPVIFVRDNGMGIDPKHATRIFGLFEKLDSSTAGTGMGLALVKRIVEVHGGKIWMESLGAGQGSTFRIILEKTRIQPRGGGV